MDVDLLNGAEVIDRMKRFYLSLIAKHSAVLSEGGRVSFCGLGPELRGVRVDNLLVCPPARVCCVHVPQSYQTTCFFSQPAWCKLPNDSHLTLTSLYSMPVEERNSNPLT